MPELGAFAVTATGGWVAKAIQAISRSTVNHAFVEAGDGPEAGLIVEAEPAGAAVRMDHYPNAIWSTMPLTDEQRTAVTREALKLVGTRYNFLDVAALGIVKLFGWKAPKVVTDRLSRPDRLQCAQLVDYAYYLAGIHLFADGRPFGMVAPSDLLDLIQREDAA